MATVYKAWDLERKRVVALKALFPFLTNDPSFRARFEREAKILHRLRHSNIIPVLDFGEQEGLLYLVMPYITMGSLRDRLEEGAVSVEQGSKIIRQIAAALQFAHDRKTIHRDIKPSNILVDHDFNAWLSDFGFARMHSASMSVTGSSLVGTPAYMSPEQILGHSTTPSSDQYALGVVLYQLATGHLPYDAETPMGLALKHATEPLPRPRSVNPKLPDAVEEVIMRALSKDGNYRYPNVTAFSDAFQAALYAIYDARTGKLKTGSIGPPTSLILEPVKSALTSLTVPVVKIIKRRRVLPWTTGILLLMLPVTALAFTVFKRTQTMEVAQVRDRAPRDVMLQSTLNTLERDISLKSEGNNNGAVVETAVAATMAALESGNDTPQITSGAGTPEVSSTETPMITEVTFESSSTMNSSPTGEINTQTSPTSTASAASPSSTPAATPTSPATMTAIPTNTDVPPTPTNTRTTLPTSPPTATNMPTDPCSALSISGFGREGKEVEWFLTNDATTGQTLTSLRLNWPQENTSLFKVELAGSTIWVGNEPGSPITINTWIGGDTSRTFTGAREIQFRFKGEAVSGEYGLVVDFSSGCSISR